MKFFQKQIILGHFSHCSIISNILCDCLTWLIETLKSKVHEMLKIWISCWLVSDLSCLFLQGLLWNTAGTWHEAEMDYLSISLSMYLSMYLFIYVATVFLWQYGYWLTQKILSHYWLQNFMMSSIITRTISGVISLKVSQSWTNKRNRK